MYGESSDKLQLYFNCKSLENIGFTLRTCVFYMNIVGCVTCAIRHFLLHFPILAPFYPFHRYTFIPFTHCIPFNLVPFPFQLLPFTQNIYKSWFLFRTVVWLFPQLRSSRGSSLKYNCLLLLLVLLMLLLALLLLLLLLLFHCLDVKLFCHLMLLPLQLYNTF